MDDDIPVIVCLRVDCSKCGHAEDETYEFDMPAVNAHPEEAREPGTCPKCGAPVQIYLRRVSALP